MLYVNLIAKNKKTHEGTKIELKAASLPFVLSALCEHETSQTKIIFKHFLLACFRLNFLGGGGGGSDLSGGHPMSDSLSQYTCGICGVAFGNRETYQSHLASEHDGKSVKCDLCQFVTTSTEKLTAHLLGKHNIVAQGKMVLECSYAPQCTFRTYGHARLKEHVDSKHLKINKFACEICGKLFSHKGSVKQHIDFTHNKVKRAKCDVCSREFSTQRDLDEHKSLRQG